MDPYFKVFYEAIWSASLVPFASDATFVAMQSFGGYNMPLAAAIAIVGATLGQLFNFQIGKIMFRFKEKGVLYISDYWFDKISKIFNKYGAFLILFSWISILRVLVVIAGFLNTKTRFVLPLIILGQIYHYGSYLL